MQGGRLHVWTPAENDLGQPRWKCSQCGSMRQVRSSAPSCPPEIKVSSDYLLVKLEADLDRSRIMGLFHAFATYPGVDCVFSADLTGLPRDRLDVLCGTPVDSGARTPPAVKL